MRLIRLKINTTLQILLFALVLLTSCSDEPTKPEEELKIEIEVVDTNLHTVWLDVEVDTAYIGNVININRDGEWVKSIWKDEMTKPDTLVRLSPWPAEAGASYTYQAAIKESGEEVFFSNKVIATMLALGTNDISWQVDTVGIWQTRLNGVWGSSPEDVYVVGIIRTEERQLPYNVMHWDGQKWVLIDYVEGEPLEVFGFGPDDVWLVGNDGGFNELIGHWDGTEWHTWETDQYDVLTGLWGTSSNNIYAVGHGGLILHYDGNNWTKMESGTTLPLRDIHGIGNKVYAIGGQSSNNEGILLQLKNDKWEIIYNDSYPANPKGGYGSSIWCASQFYTYLYLNPDIRLMTNSIGFGFDDRGTAINKIRGTGYNNIFAVGDYGLIIHSNGRDELTMPFFEKPGGDSMFDLMVFENAVFVVGYHSGRGTIYRGTF